MENTKSKKNSVLWVGDAGLNTYLNLHKSIQAHYDHNILLYDENPTIEEAHVTTLKDNENPVAYAITTLKQALETNYKADEFDVLVGSPMEVLFTSLLEYYTDQLKQHHIENHENHEKLTTMKVFEPVRFKKTIKSRPEKVVFVNSDGLFKDLKAEAISTIAKNKASFSRCYELDSDPSKTNEFFFNLIDK